MKSTVVLAIVVCGCGGVTAQSALHVDASEAKGDVFAAPDKFEAPVPDAGAEADGADAADGAHEVDAVAADADGRDGVTEIAEAAPEAGRETAAEAPAIDVISGTWSFNFTPNRGRGEMMLKLNGAFITGTYAAMGIPPNDSPGSGAVTGSYDRATLTLTFTGSISANASGPVEYNGGAASVPSGKGLIGTDVVGFMASAH